MIFTVIMIVLLLLIILISIILGNTNSEDEMSFIFFLTINIILVVVYYCLLKTEEKHVNNLISERNQIIDHLVKTGNVDNWIKKRYKNQIIKIKVKLYKNKLVENLKSRR